MGLLLMNCLALLFYVSEVLVYSRCTLKCGSLMGLTKKASKDFM